jgi:hypothetical protein
VRCGAFDDEGAFVLSRRDRNSAARSGAFDN